MLFGERTEKNNNKKVGGKKRKFKIPSQLVRRYKGIRPGIT